jgi:CheY-like chemotaxis protein
MENKTYQLQAIRVNLFHTLKKVTSDLKSFADTKRVRFLCQIESPEGVCQICGETLLCYSLFANLIRNAIEASPEEGVITISVSQGMNGDIRVEIHNQGPVPMAIRDCFFDKYVTSGKKGGTGIGTYSAKLMVQTLCGEISMKTDDVDGTTLSVVLPAATHDTVIEPPTINNQKVSRAYENIPPMKILIVDDDADNRYIISTYLNHPKISSFNAIDGNSAVDAYQRENDFDIILMDLELPKMNGLEAVRHIRRMENHQKPGLKKPVAIIAMSAHDDEKTRLECLNTGFDDYLRKPFSQEKLYQSILSNQYFNEKVSVELLSKPVIANFRQLDLHNPDLYEIDSVFKEMIPDFLKKKCSNIENLSTFLEREEFEEIQKLAHKVRGGLQMYGFCSLGDQCALIEKSAKERDSASLSLHICGLKEAFSNVKIVFVDKNSSNIGFGSGERDFTYAGKEKDHVSG